MSHPTNFGAPPSAEDLKTRIQKKVAWNQHPGQEKCRAWPGRLDSFFSQNPWGPKKNHKPQATSGMHTLRGFNLFRKTQMKPTQESPEVWECIASLWEGCPTSHYWGVFGEIPNEYIPPWEQQNHLQKTKWGDNPIRFAHNFYSFRPQKRTV